MTPSTTTYNAGDLVLVKFPHTSGAKAAVRPALVLLDIGDLDLVLARVTTQGHASPFDVTLSDWQNAGLLSSSTIRLHKVATLEKTLVQRRLGSLQPGDRARVSSVLKQVFGNW